MFKRLGLAWSVAVILTIALIFWPVQVITVTLPKEDNRLLAIRRIYPGDLIHFSYRHSVELTRVEGRFQVTPESELVAVETRMESVGTGLPNTHPDRTITKNGWLIIDEHKKAVGPLRFYVVPINQARLNIADQQIDLSGLESGTLIQVSAEKMKWGTWLWRTMRG
jgi:hypothetical protein